MMKIRIGLALLIIVLLMSLSLPGCAKEEKATPPPAPAPAPAPTPKPAPAPAPPVPKPVEALPASIIAGTTAVGASTYFRICGTSTVMQRYTGIKVIVQPFANIPSYMQALGNGDIQYTEAGTYEAYHSYHGTLHYKDAGPKAISTLGGGYYASLAWFTRPDTGIKTIPDLEGKVVMYVSKTSPITSDRAKLSLEYYGLADKVTSIPRSSPASAAQACIEKKVDAYNCPLGPHMYELEAATGMVVIPIPNEVVEWVGPEKCAELGMTSGVRKAGFYGLPEDTEVIATPYITIVYPDCTEAMAYALTKAIYDHPDDLKAIHPACAEYTVENYFMVPPPIPFHAGAVRYFKEKGVWGPEQEEHQQSLLAAKK
ncbi:TAXI family TRAP transporter solute-binding subunit [Chloroflexota bacterium]